METKTLVNTLVTAILKVGKPPLLVGKPQLAKTALCRLAALKAGCKEENIIFLHPSIADPTDLKGMPAKITRDDGHTIAQFIPFDVLQRLLDATELTVVIIDDMGQAPFSVQAGLMPLVHDRLVCGQKISDHVRFLAATNSKEDGAGVMGLLEPLKTRFFPILTVEADAMALTNHLLVECNAPVEVVAFLRTFPQHAHEMPKKLKGMDPWPGYRTWEAMCDWINAGSYDLEVWEGIIGKAMATQFHNFCQFANKVPDIDAILRGEDIPLPEDLGLIHTVCITMVKKVTDRTIGNAIKWLDKHDKRWIVLFMQESVQVKPRLMNSTPFTKWMAENRDLFKAL